MSTLSLDAEVESALLSQAQNGNADAFYQLVEPCQRAVFSAAVGILGNENNAEEVAQEALLKAFKALPRFRGESKFSTWLVQIALNEARMKRRKYRVHLHDSLDEPLRGSDGDFIPREFADWREIPSEALETKELREAIANALRSLPEKYRSVFVLRDVQSRSIQETAELLGISESNVKTRLLRARLKMREALAPGWGGAWQEKGRSVAVA
jgi:RNA polymerase sigma-70 factor (ECF subfamily)